MLKKWFRMPCKRTVPDYEKKALLVDISRNSFGRDVKQWYRMTCQKTLPDDISKNVAGVFIQIVSELISKTLHGPMSKTKPEVMTKIKKNLSQT